MLLKKKTRTMSRTTVWGKLLYGDKFSAEWREGVGHVKIWGKVFRKRNQLLQMLPNRTNLSMLGGRKAVVAFSRWLVPFLQDWDRELASFAAVYNWRATMAFSKYLWGALISGWSWTYNISIQFLKPLRCCFR